MTTNKFTKELDTLDNIIRRDPGNRLFTRIVETSGLAEAASTLSASQRVLIITGFCVLDAMVGETDGPPGALVIGYALEMLGKDVLYVTDEFSMDLLRKGQKIYHASVVSPVVPISINNVQAEALEILKGFSPDHIIAIERPGKAADGHSYSMRGEQLSHVVPQLDLFFESSSEHPVWTTAIGDGGNEMGMGGFYEKVVESVPLGQLTACTTTADYLIPAGISNWAGYALAAALSILNHKNVMPPLETDTEVVEVIVNAGSVDGCTKKPEVSVDGIPFDVYLEAINEIRQVVTAHLEKV